MHQVHVEKKWTDLEKSINKALNAIPTCLILLLRTESLANTTPIY